MSLALRCVNLNVAKSNKNSYFVTNISKSFRKQDLVLTEVTCIAYHEPVRYKEDDDVCLTFTLFFNKEKL